jgi:uncharacterized protein YbaR (Trm112 family)
MPMAEIYKTLQFEKLGADAFGYFMDFGGERLEFYSPDVYHRILGELGFEDVQVEYFMASQIAKMAYAQFELFLVMGGGGMAEPEHDKMREFFFDFVNSTVVPLLSIDRELCLKEGKGLNLFVTAKKRGPTVPETRATESGRSILDRAACPQCKGNLAAGTECYSCQACGLEYPVVDSIPLLIPFYAEGHARIKEIRSAQPAPYTGGKLGPLKRKLIKVPGLYRFYRMIKSRGRD